MMMKTALIILNYNNSRDTRNCIDSIFRHNSAPVKFVVVDNGSSPEQLESLKAELSGVFTEGYDVVDSDRRLSLGCLGFATLIVSDRNLGYARGNNLALDAVENDSEIDKVLILNNDILFVDDILPGLSAKLDGVERCALVSPVLYKKDMKGLDFNCARRNVSVSSLIKSNILHYYYKYRKLSAFDIAPERYLFLANGIPENGYVEADLPSGSCMLLYKDFFKSIGRFDPTTFLYFEENIISAKLRKLGLRMVISLDERCIHLGASTTNALSDSRWLVREAKRSESFYVNRFSGASAFMKLAHRASVSFFLFSFALQKFKKRISGK